MVTPSDEGKDKVFTAVEVQVMLDKQRNELNERFATLEARFSALDENNAHPKVVEVAPKEKPNSNKARV
jgi:sugar-specific transcriptional regulator TrmB